jgi:PAS domain S-box-containing protein
MAEPVAPRASPRREPEAVDPRATLEGQLRDSPDLVEQLLEEMPAGFLSTDTELRITFVNRTAEATWGYRREDILGRHLWELFPEAQTPETIDAITHLALTGEPVQFETFYAPTRKWVQVFALRSAHGFSTFFLDVTEHRLAEIERNAAEARYRDIVEEVPAITYLDDAFDGGGGLIFVSPQSKEILGYSPEEWQLNPDSWREHIHPDDRDAVLEENARCRRRGIPFEAEYRMLARDGRVVWFHDRATPILDEAGRPKRMHGVMVDITAHRAAEEEIRSRDAILAAVGFTAERLLRSASWEHAIGDVLARLGESAAVDRVDLIELRFDGDEIGIWSRAEWCAPGVASVGDRLRGTPILGERAWVSKLQAGETLTGSSGPLAEDAPCPYLSGVCSYALAPLRLASGLWGFLALGQTTTDRRWSAAEMDAVATAAAAVAAAIQREAAETALRESEARFRRLADGAPDVIFRYRLLPDPGIEYLSSAVEAMTGYTAEEFLADQELLFRIIHPGDLPLLEEMVTDTDSRHVLRWITRDGGLIWTEQKFVPVRGDDGRLVALEGIARDVSGRVEADRRLQESVLALRRSNEERQHLLARLVKAQEEERMRVANDIHDDAIQIMTAVGLRLAVLRGQLKRSEVEPTLTDAEETVGQAIRRLRRLLFELRPMSLDNSGLVAAIADHVRLLEEPGGPEFSIEDALGGEPPVECRTILYRIAQEALTNARKHARAEHVWIEVEREGAGVRVRIRDDGVGFDPASAPSGGLGHVGVPSMRERAHLAGGWMRIDSAPGRGTTVESWVPRIVAMPPPVEQATDWDPGSSAAADPA